jgi:hypothetical protein
MEVARCCEAGSLAYFLLSALRDRVPLVGSLSPSYRFSMPRLPHKYRPLYLLALFQLVGGPVVLLLVMLFSKLGVHQVAQHGFAEGISQAWNSAEWQTAMNVVMQGEAGLPSTQKGKDKVPAKEKDTKVKFFATELERAVGAPMCDDLERIPWRSGDVFAMTRAQAPPGPPPRWA